MIAMREKKPLCLIKDTPSSHGLVTRHHVGPLCVTPQKVKLSAGMARPTASLNSRLVQTRIVPLAAVDVNSAALWKNLHLKEDAESLRARGILYAPDYVVNVGGAMAGLGLETQGWTQERAEQEVTESVRCALRRVLELAATEGITTDAAAQQIAEERLSAAK